jgi:hypothetical protein
MKKTRFAVRDHLPVELRMKRSPLVSARILDRAVRLDVRRLRGVLKPIIRGCRLPDWLLG